MASMLSEANRQLFKRSTDESYDTFDSFIDKLRSDYERSNEIIVDKRNVRFSTRPTDSGLSEELVSELDGNAYGMNNWSFTQFCNAAKVPINLAQALLPGTVATILNERSHFYSNGVAKCLVQQVSTGNHLLRSVYSTSYARVPNLTIAEIVRDKAEGEYGMVPGGHMAGKCGVGISAEEAERMGLRKSAGLYVGERDMFMFLLSPDKIEVRDTPFYVGFYVANSEVKDSTLSLTSFICDGVCANHLIWGAKDVQDVRWVHKGDPDNIMFQFQTALDFFLAKYMEQKSDFAIMIERANEIEFAPDRDKCYDRLSTYGFTRNQAIGAVTYASDRYQDNWNKLWPITSGLTYVSQTSWNQDDRIDVDKKASIMVQSLMS